MNEMERRWKVGAAEIVATAHNGWIAVDVTGPVLIDTVLEQWQRQINAQYEDWTPDRWIERLACRVLALEDEVARLRGVIARQGTDARSTGDRARHPNADAPGD